MWLTNIDNKQRGYGCQEWFMDDLGLHLGFERVVWSGWAEEIGKASEDQTDHGREKGSLSMEKEARSNYGGSSKATRRFGRGWSRCSPVPTLLILIKMKNHHNITVQSDKDSKMRGRGSSCAVIAWALSCVPGPQWMVNEKRANDCTSP